MKIVPEFSDGWFWARHVDGTVFVVLREDGQWLACGLEGSLNSDFEPAKQIIKPIPMPVH